MIWVKIVLLIVLMFLPLVAAVLALPWIGKAAVLALLIFWIADPSWGAWVYAGIALNLIQFRAWTLYLEKLSMAAYVSSPSMAIQNGTSVALAIGALIGGARSFVVGDIAGIAFGVVGAALILSLQGFLFPNPAVIAQACGLPLVAPEEVISVLQRVSYPTLLKFNQYTRRNGISGPILVSELESFLERNPG